MLRVSETKFLTTASTKFFILLNLNLYLYWYFLWSYCY